MKVLLTFTGFHDPYAASAATGEMRAGPILTVVAERSFDRVYLYSTPRAADISAQTAAAIAERHPAVKLTVLEVPLKDPTNYLGILRQVRAHFRKLNAAHPEAEYFISVSLLDLLNKYLIEVKADNEMPDPQVQAKAEAGKVFCEQATAHAATTGGKPWSYLLVPESSVAPNMTLEGLSSKHIFQPTK